MTRPLDIVVTADPELPVPPRLYGGIERIIDLLVRGLVQRGHHVTLIAHRDSEGPATLVPYSGARSTSTLETIGHAAQVTQVVMRQRPDVVQSFGRLAYLTGILPWAVPKVMSYQREVTPASVRWGRRIAHGTLQFTSCSRRLIRDVADLAPWRVIHNAVPIDRYAWTTSVPADAPLVFLGRVEHIKGPHVAIDVARRAGRRLVIAGTVADEHRDYFEAHVRPAIRDGQVTYVGPVDDQAKSDLLGQASALLMPVLWDEPFGIVMAEALACGTPVVGLDRGAVAEVVEDGHTGMVCGTEDEMVTAVTQIARIDRAACRLAAERRFSAPVLVDAYESLYEELAGPHRAADRTGREDLVSDPRPSAH
jgi:glycosyltransferase involved in cell wall biosynthesis